ncbi:ParA family protein [Larkinella sp. C7]|uniref:ParA family protein n=1 Tax=Larkinella sp. C7 TaxID=2576607 RepID=UPI001110FEFB|nr:AAA family ATPase [Larkinella sp. C7]
MITGKILAVANHKGGVAKTTSTINLGAGLARMGKRVLLVDLDPQANLTQSLGIAPEGPRPNIYGMIRGVYPLAVVEVANRLSVIPSTLDLSGAEIELSGETGREYILKELLQPARSNYDFILIDCPPSLGLLTLNALTAADQVLIPVQAQFLATQGLAKLIEVVEKIQKRLNQGLTVGGVFLTQYDSRKILNRNVAEAIETHFKGRVFTTKIRDNVALAEAPTQGLDIFRYDPKSNGAEDYTRLTEELL